MKQAAKLMVKQIAKKAAKIKTSKRLDSIDDTSFFKKKIEKGTKMLSVAGLPKAF